MSAAQPQKKSNKTTALGIIGAIGFLLVAWTHYADGDPNTTVSWMQVFEQGGYLLAALGIGGAGLFSRDHNVSSHDAGLFSQLSQKTPRVDDLPGAKPSQSGLFRRVAPVLLLGLILLPGCVSPDLKPVAQCLARIEADYRDQKIVKVPDERIRASRLLMIQSCKSLVDEASK